MSPRRKLVLSALLSSSFLRGFGIVTAVFAVAASTAAQNIDESGSEVFLDLRTGLRFDDNYDSVEDPKGSTYLWENGVVLGYNSETSVDTINLSTGATFEVGEFAEEPDKNTDIRDPFVQLAYGRFGPGSSFDTKLRYSESDNGFSFTRDPLTSKDLIVDRGTRQDTDFEMGLTLGEGGPVSFDGSAAYRQVRYRDTTNIDLSDEDRLVFDVALGLSVTRSARLLLLADYYDYDDLDDVDADERRTSAGIGISAEIDPALTFYGSASYARNYYEETIDGIRQDRTEESPAFDFRLTKDLKNGQVYSSLYNDFTSTGLRSTLSAGRSMELRSGALNFSLGATRTESGEVNGVGDLAWVQQYKASEFSVNFDSAVVTEDDEDLLRSNLSVRYYHDLTKLSGLSLSMRVGAAEGLEEDGTDRRLAGFEVSLSRELTEEWDFVTGYRHSYADDNDEITTRNVFFATLDRRFTLRP